MTPEQVVAAARGWIGVPFKHQGRTREGIDCAGLGINVGLELGEDFPDINGYERSPDGSMQPACERYLVRIPYPVVGCLLMMRFATQPQHIAIAGNYRYGGLSVIHALERTGFVTEHRLDATWRGNVVACYRFKGME